MARAVGKPGDAARTPLAERRSVLGKSGILNGSESETGPFTPAARRQQVPKRPQPLKCPECNGEKLYRDGLRYFPDGESVQRHLCRSCGYRFSDSERPKEIYTNPSLSLNFSATNRLSRQVCDEPRKRASGTRQVLDLATVEPLKDGLAGATTPTADIKGKITEYLWHLKKEGRKDLTIIAHRKVLTRLANHGADLLDPESVKNTIAYENVHVNSKVHYVGVYKVFASWLNLNWKPPKYKPLRKIPWIPREAELDQLIAGFKKKTVTFLMTLKETMARSGEVWALKWTDLNGNVLTISTPEKGSNPRQIKISDKLVTLLNALPRKDDRIFGPTTSLQNFRGNFTKRRGYLAKKLGDPRINQITFHTFRHWGATMLYHKTKDILYVQRQLGHRNIESTMVYTQLISFEGDEYTHQVAKTVDEAGKLVDAGFEYVCDYEEEGKLFRKRK